MRATTGFYAEKIDHLRALAVFLVFFWHFVHGSGTHPLIPFDYAPPAALFPVSLLEQGHAGVALFMVLSGYLFARIVGEERIKVVPFLRNRALRLIPLLALVVMPGLLNGRETPSSLLSGFLFGWAADGTWSVAVEFQFYLLLPVILWLGRGRMQMLLASALLVAILTRWSLWMKGTELVDLVNYSLVGRADNFIVGMALARLEPRLRASKRSLPLAAALVLAFLAHHHAFNISGGLTTSLNSPIWIVQPMIESIGFAALIHIYYGSAFRLTPRIGWLVAKIGEYSYSIYLLHFTIVLLSAQLIFSLGLSGNIWIISLLSVPVFALCVAVGGVTYTWVEKPFLRMRVPYLSNRPAVSSLAATPTL